MLLEQSPEEKTNPSLKENNEQNFVRDITQECAPFCASYEADPDSNPEMYGIQEKQKARTGGTSSACDVIEPTLSADDREPCDSYDSEERCAASEEVLAEETEGSASCCSEEHDEVSEEVLTEEAEIPVSFCSEEYDEASEEVLTEEAEIPVSFCGEEHDEASEEALTEEAEVSVSFCGEENDETSGEVLTEEAPVSCGLEESAEAWERIPEDEESDSFSGDAEVPFIASEEIREDGEEAFSVCKSDEYSELPLEVTEETTPGDSQTTLNSEEEILYENEYQQGNPAEAVHQKKTDSDFPGILWNENLINTLSAHFLICTEKIQNKGEDCGIESFNQIAGIIGAFDGCGGLGARACPGFDNKTEAYLASRVSGAAAIAWFEKNCIEPGSWSVDALNEKIMKNLTACKEKAGDSGSRLRGSLNRPFPTTAAVITFIQNGDRLQTLHVWAGDSRTYVLDADGLAQISTDDIDGEDAYSNLKNDGSLTNVISGDGRYILHSGMFTPVGPCIFMAASDGAFGYLTSPMAFEEMILSALDNACNIVHWKQSLEQMISYYAGDDQTLAVAVFGFDSFQDLKAYFKNRKHFITSVTEKFEAADEAEKQSLWDSYKAGYYRYSDLEVQGR